MRPGSHDVAIAGPLPRSYAAHWRSDWIVFAVVIGLFWAVPLLLGGFALYIGAIVAVLATAALGLQIMVGLAGQLSLGHAAFIGIGAYTSILLQKLYGVPFVAAVAVAVVVSGLIGLLMAQLVRLSGIYFKIATFGFGIIVYQVLSNWSSVTGGHTGLIGIPPIRVLGWTFRGQLSLFVIATGFLTLTYILLLRLTHGRIGRAFRALGQNEAAAQSIGIPVTAYKMAVVTLGCGAAGLAGTLIPHIYNFLNPEEFTWIQSLVLLIIITVGGLGSMPGAVIGAVILVVVPEYLRAFQEYKMLAYGVLLIASMIFMPRGIVGVLSAASARLSRWRGRGSAQ